MWRGVSLDCGAGVSEGYPRGVAGLWRLRAGQGCHASPHNPPPGDAFEGKGPQRQPQKRLDRRSEEVAKAHTEPLSPPTPPKDLSTSSDAEVLSLLRTQAAPAVLPPHIPHLGVNWSFFFCPTPPPTALDPPPPDHNVVKDKLLVHNVSPPTPPTTTPFKHSPPPPLSDVLERLYTAGGGGVTPPPPSLLLFQCWRLTAKILLRRLRCQEDLSFKTLGPPSVGTIGGPWEEGGPSQTRPPPPNTHTYPPLNPPPQNCRTPMWTGSQPGPPRRCWPRRARPSSRSTWSAVRRSGSTSPCTCAPCTTTWASSPSRTSPASAATRTSPPRRTWTSSPPSKTSTARSTATSVPSRTTSSGASSAWPRPSRCRPLPPRLRGAAPQKY